MATHDHHDHDHPHDHDHGHEPDPHGHRSLHVLEAPLDPANQSLADALKATFRVLKFFMLLVFIVYLFSGVFTVEQGEKAVVLSFGKLDPREYGPGLHFSWPYPINEHVKLPSGRPNTVSIDDSHFLQIRKEEENTPRAGLMRGGLHPTRDGVLLTGDRGLVHVRWQVVFHIDDVLRYVKTVKDDKIQQAETVIRRALESVAIRNAAGMEAEHMAYQRTKELQDAVKRDMNDELARLEAGIVVDKVDIVESIMPVPTLQTYAQVQRSENTKQAMIRAAEQAADRVLNAAAGAAHERLIAKLDERDLAAAAGDRGKVTAIEAELDQMLEHEVGGEAGAIVNRAKAEYTSTIQQMRSDRDQYAALIDEYRRDPVALTNRLWADAQRALFENLGVKKIFVPKGQKEIRLEVGPDPVQTREDEIKRIEQQTGAQHAPHGGPAHR